MFSHFSFAKWVVLKVQEGGENGARKSLTRLTHTIVGVFCGLVVSNFFTKDISWTIGGAILGAILGYYDIGRFDLWEAFRKFVGVFAGLYGILAVLSPEKYPIAQLPKSQIPLAGLALIVFALYVLRRELNLG